MCSHIADTHSHDSARRNQRRRSCPRQAQSRGSVTGFVVCSIAMLIACAGLAFDGGRMIAAYVRASDIAENAARAGSQVVVGIRAGNPQLNITRARQQAQRFLSSAGATGTVRVETRRVEVRVTSSVHMKILGLFGVGDKVVSVSRSASPFMG